MFRQLQRCSFTKCYARNNTLEANVVTKGTEGKPFGSCSPQAAEQERIVLAKVCADCRDFSKFVQSNADTEITDDVQVVRARSVTAVTASVIGGELGMLGK